MMRRFLGLALAAACSGGAAPDSGGSAEGDFAGQAGTRLLYVDPLDVDGTPLWLQINADSWELRHGERWRNADQHATLDIRRDNGLWVDGSQLLPANPEQGATGDGVRITASGEATVHYGTFPVTVSALIDAGAFAGEAVFADTVGPIALTVDGDAWQLGFYETVEDAIGR